MDIKNELKKAIQHEGHCMLELADQIDDKYLDAIKEILMCKGRVVITGVGKSGHIGKKIAASFASTGTVSFFMHSTEGIHGDLGMITNEDIVLAISNSGETKEVLDLLPSIKIIGAKLISITGNADSRLAKASNIHLMAKVKRETDSLNLAPTASAAAALVIGDALAIVLSRLKGFKKNNFAVFHPGGSLGKRLLCDQQDAMEQNSNAPGDINLQQISKGESL